jgi:hypothetical protein
MSPYRMVRALQSVAAIGIAVTLWALLWPVRANVAPLPAALPAVGAPDSVRAEADSLTTEQIVDANIFSLSRRRPARRTMPTSTTTLSDTMASLGLSLTDTASTMPATDSVGPRAPDRVPRLYGVVDGGGGAQALLRLERARPGAALYREGDRAGGYRVRRIERDRVALDGPRGGLVLRLAPRRSTP